VSRRATFSAPSKRSRRRWWIRGALLLVAAIGALTALTAFRLLGAARDLDEAEALVDAAGTALEDGRLGDAREKLGEAQSLLLHTNRALYSAPELELVAWAPVVRQNIESLRDSVGLAATVVNGGRRILDASTPLESPSGTLEVSLSDGSVPLDAISAANVEVNLLSAQLPSGRPGGGDRFLLSQTKELRDAVYEEAFHRRAQLDVLGRGLTLLRHLAGGDGPRRYLLAVANTAEMRGTGGMILNYGVLEGVDGAIELTEFGRIDELALRGPVDVPSLPPDYLARWSGFDPLSRWRNANLGADFTVVAPVLERMYEASTGDKVNGVIQIDPTGLAHLLAGVGPVEVPEVGTVTADNVVDLTLNQAYFQFPGVEERSDVLGDVAEAAFRRLVDGEIPSLRRLGTELVAALDSGHLKAHAGVRDNIQSRLVAFGADGALPSTDEADSVALTVQNLAGNKLDYYLDTALTLTGSLSPTTAGELEAEVVLRNAAPAGATDPTYIFGPGPTANPLPAGVVRSLVTLYLPVGSGLEDVSGATLVEPAVSGTEAGRPFASFTVDVPAGETRSVVLRLVTAPQRAGGPELVAIPTPRVRPTTLSVDIATSAGVLRGDVELNRRWAFAPGSDPTPVLAPAFR
jgi:hypothetical protein